MKKALFLILLSLVACKKDDKENVQPKDNNAQTETVKQKLKGSIWVSSYASADASHDPSDTRILRDTFKIIDEHTAIWLHNKAQIGDTTVHNKTWYWNDGIERTSSGYWYKDTATTETVEFINDSSFYISKKGILININIPSMPTSETVTQWNRYTYKATVNNTYKFLYAGPVLEKSQFTTDQWTTVFTKID